jgi:hypothetical protein
MIMANMLLGPIEEENFQSIKKLYGQIDFKLLPMSTLLLDDRIALVE